MFIKDIHQPQNHITLGIRKKVLQLAGFDYEKNCLIGMRMFIKDIHHLQNHTTLGIRKKVLQLARLDYEKNFGIHKLKTT